MNLSEPLPSDLAEPLARSNGRLMLRVHDSGPGFKTEDVIEGIGLRSTRARLEQLYTSAQQFAYGNDDRGAWVTIELPFREYEAPEGAEDQAWMAQSGR